MQTYQFFESQRSSTTTTSFSKRANRTVWPFPQVSKKLASNRLCHFMETKILVLGAEQKPLLVSQAFLIVEQTTCRRMSFEKLGIQGTHGFLNGEMLESFERDRQITTKSRKKL